MVCQRRQSHWLNRPGGSERANIYTGNKTSGKPVYNATYPLHWTNKKKIKKGYNLVSAIHSDSYSKTVSGHTKEILRTTQSLHARPSQNAERGPEQLQ